MKKYYFLLLLVAGITNAQVVNFPDANFKTKLLSAAADNDVAYSGGVRVKIDTNDDGNIQLTEAQAIDSLDVSMAAIADMTGISSFSNLKKFWTRGNAITSLDVSTLTGLINLDFSGDQITSVNLTGLVNLKVLNCHTSPITTFDLSALTNLREVYLAQNALTSLNVSGLTQLRYLECAVNALTALDVSTCTNLRQLVCDYNQLTQLDVSGLPNLFRLTCPNNLLTSLDVSHNPALVELNTSYNPLTVLDVSGLANLNNVDARNCTLTSFNAAGCGNLDILWVMNNQLTQIILSGCSHLSQCNAEYNLFTEIDFSDCHTSQNLTLGFNPNLERVYLKNGYSCVLNVLENPNLQYICADEGEVYDIQLMLNQFGFTNTVVNSYCFYGIGGEHNTISGTMRFDADNNGCDAGDTFQPMMKIGITGDGHEGSTVLDAAGNYAFYFGTGNYTLTPQIENAAFFTISPPTATVNFASNNNTTTQNFCVTANGVHHDVEVVAIPFGARPGFDTYYEIIYKNKGNQTESGTINFAFNDSLLDFVSSEPATNTQSMNNLSWNYSGLMPFETRYLFVALNVNSPQEVPAVNIGDTLNGTTTITALGSDETPADNTAALSQIVTGAFDPNDKTCVEGETIAPEKIGDYVHYVINFENTGTAPAEKIVVRDVIDTAKFDMSSLQLLSTSDPVRLKITDSTAEFFFENINLAAQEHGNVVFKIKTKADLLIGTAVSNTADIFFDYNFPVTTNTATSVFQLLATGTFKNDNSVTISPNPATDNISIKANGRIKSIQLFDVQGRIVTTDIADSSQTKIDISQFSKGIYFVKVITQSGTSIEKVIKK